MIRGFLSAVAVGVFITSAPSLMRADVTIRYTFETSVPMMPAAGTSHPMVIYMKGNKGVTVMDSETMIADFSRQQITIVDAARKKYATIAAADYAAKISAQAAALMSDIGTIPAMDDILKGMKTTCDTKDSDAAEMIQGVQSVKHEVLCTMTMTLPDNGKEATMAPMAVKLTTLVWSASPSERVRVPGLWQLSGYELWQNYFMNPMGRDNGMGKIFPDALRPIMESVQKNQSAILRSTMEVSMHMSIPGMPAGDTPFMTMKTEMTGLSTELLDDSLFAVPADYSEEPFESVMKGITDAAGAAAKENMKKLEGGQAAGWAFGPPAAPQQ